MTFKDIATEFLQMVSSDLDPYTSKKGFIKSEGDFKFTLFTPSHIQFAKYGRAKGKQPPVEDILEWVKRKGIKFDNTSEEGTAWAIAKSIAKNGTKNYVPNAPNAMDEAIKNNLQKFNEQISKVAKEVIVKDEMREFYSKQFPKKTTYKI